MRTSFLHVADLRLGYRNPEMPKSFDQIAQQFEFVIDHALEQRVGFVVFAGNLFDHPDVAPAALQVAWRGLTRLRDKGIGAVAIRGQRDISPSGNELTWFDLLSQENLLSVLDASVSQAKLKLSALDRNSGQGAYQDFGRTRVFGLHYAGAMTGLLLGEFTDALGRLDNREADFRIIVLNVALEHFSDSPGAKLAYSDVLGLQRHVNYVALGGCETSYEAEGWIYNPGSASLVQVTVDTAVTPKHTARYVAFPNNQPPPRPVPPPSPPTREAMEQEALQNVTSTEDGASQSGKNVVDVLSQFIWHDSDPDEVLGRLLQSHEEET